MTEGAKEIIKRIEEIDSMDKHFFNRFYIGEDEDEEEWGVLIYKDENERLQICLTSM